MDQRGIQPLQRWGRSTRWWWREKVEVDGARACGCGWKQLCQFFCILVKCTGGDQTLWWRQRSDRRRAHWVVVLLLLHSLNSVFLLLWLFSCVEGPAALMNGNASFSPLQHHRRAPQVQAQQLASIWRRRDTEDSNVHILLPERKKHLRWTEEVVSGTTFQHLLTARIPFRCLNHVTKSVGKHLVGNDDPKDPKGVSVTRVIVTTLLMSCLQPWSSSSWLELKNPLRWDVKCLQEPGRDAQLPLFRFCSCL